MTVYSSIEARERLSDVFDDASRDGSVRIRLEDGREYDVVPVRTSPFDIESANVDITLDEIVEAIREGRERG